MSHSVTFKDLGSIDYKEAWDYQELLFREVINKKLANRDLPEAEKQFTGNYMIFCEHPHVFTLGKSGAESNLLINQEQLQKRNIAYYKINRGGDITYHGPGQLVVYPILNLDYFFTDIHRYMRTLEEAVIRMLAEYGIVGERMKGSTGVWLDSDHPGKARKICAMGVRTSHWVTMHGIALNINPDLQYFTLIVPCGITDKAVTSMEKELKHMVSVEEVKSKLKRHLSDVFELEYSVNVPS
ncbi:MAG TPA: lipoyl(octanoyl) transferase LipB [Bacteroidia bacterium]|jgi:lipoyl(octanoyl) transferase|nr:lipoyl(octanoyl) transferase LipB [Bacteroidia bacterium]